jgi:hypothetical protein
MDAAQASPMSPRMAVSREQNDHPLVPRPVTTARTGCHGGLSESVPADEVDAADYFPVRTTRFDPRGALSDDELAAEHISGMRWWRHGDIAEYGGTDLFSPQGVGKVRGDGDLGSLRHADIGR